MDSYTLNFDFTPVHTPKGEKFFISVLTKEGTIFFEMQKDYYGHWCIVEPAPAWLLSVQLQLNAAIESIVNTPIAN